ncbi:SH3 domain-containing protein [Flavobacterium hibisci]|uniref:SH3 domain-containing protein n=1 Tax=Flavobacterium hibisci TaxID=1914462 RepID=UPI001CC0A314|nr:SH3 domain-containing protein [Flavobacterium hibisci]MBZ4043832.1 SH3 domain-containing protein [Flavobacterium hibisci]
MNRIQFQIDNHTTNEKSYTTLDSLRKVVDGADAELYVETYKNAIIYDTNKLLNYLEKKHQKIDENVLAFFKQDEKTFKLIDEKLKSNKNIKKGYIKDSDGYTNLRKDKNKNSEIIQKVIQNEEITILDDSDDWYLVETKEKNKGYIHNSRIINDLKNLAIIDISPKWYGKYFVDISSTQEYLQTIELNLTSDSCLFKVTSLAENKEYQLEVIEKHEKLYLKYKRLIKFESTYIENDNKLAEEKEFGYLIYDGKKYLWISPYLDYTYSDGKKEKYILRKHKL